MSSTKFFWDHSQPMAFNLDFICSRYAYANIGAACTTSISSLVFSHDGRHTMNLCRRVIRGWINEFEIIEFAKQTFVIRCDGPEKSSTNAKSCKAHRVESSELEFKFEGVRNCSFTHTFSLSLSPCDPENTPLT